MNQDTVCRPIIGAGRMLICCMLILCLARPSMAGETIAYTYDSQGRLVRVIRSDTVSGVVTTITYQYDQADNRVRKQVVRAP